MYKGAGEKQQRKVDGLVGASVNSASLQMSEDEQYEMLKKELQEIELKILRGEGNRKNLGKRKFQLQTNIQRLRPGKRMVGLNQIFMDEARRQLPRDQWDKIMESAQHIWRLRNKQTRNDPVSEQTYLQAERLGIDL